MEATGKLERKAAYNAYDSTRYKRDCFDERSGGYLVVERQRIIQSQRNKQERAKFEKELAMCRTLAQNGYAVAYLKDEEHGYDILLNGAPADLKKTATYNNIQKYAKKAVREQGAKLVVFEFEQDVKDIYTHLLKLSRNDIHGYFYFSSSRNRVYEF